MLIRMAAYIAVDLAKDLMSIRLARRAGGVERRRAGACCLRPSDLPPLRLVRIEVPGQVLDPLVPRQRAVRIHLLKPERELVGEPRVRPALPRRIRRLEVPLQHSLSVGKAPSALRSLSGGHEEDLGLDVLRLHFAGLDLGRLLPERG